MLRMGSCVRFCCHNILFLRTFPLVSALLANQKLIFDERISCITRHDDFSPRSDRTVSLQVGSFPRRLQRQRLSSSSRSNGKRVIL